MKIRKAPYPIDFLGNSPEYILLATPDKSAGRICKCVFNVNSLPAGTLTITIDEESLTWTLSSDPGDGIWEMLAVASGADAMYDTLEGKLIYNPHLNQDFMATLKIVSGTLVLTLTAREPGPHTVSMVHSASNNHITEAGEWITGLNRVPHKDWRAMAFFRISTSQGVFKTPEMYFEESGGDVHVSTDIIRAYMPKPDIPGWGVYYNAEHCPNATLKARLYYGEIYAESGFALQIVTGTPSISAGANNFERPSPQESGMFLHTLSRSHEITLVNGELQDRAWQNNIPDWNDPSGTHFYLRNGTGIFGQDDNDTILTPRDTEQYVYMYNYGTASVTARVQAKASLADGTEDDDWEDENITLLPGVNRITVHIDNPEVVALRVEISTNNVVKAERNYIVRAFAHGHHTFLMLNAMNLYETLVVEDLAREENTEGERRIIAGHDSYGTTDRQTVFTARCHPRNAKGLCLLRTAFAKQENLLLDGKFAWRIDMVPGTLTIGDEGSDLTECEFKFRLREKVNRDPQTIDVGGEINMSEQIVATDTVFR